MELLSGINHKRDTTLSLVCKVAIWCTIMGMYVPPVLGHDGHALCLTRGICASHQGKDSSPMTFQNLEHESNAYGHTNNQGICGLWSLHYLP